MVNQKNLKRITILILIISLIYATVYPTIFGLISYAQESEEAAQEEETKLLKIEVSDFSKNKMQEETTEYQEKLTLIPAEYGDAKSIEISDDQTIFEKKKEDTTENAEEAQETEQQTTDNTKIYYTSTKIDKLQILEAFQTGGNLEITYKTEEASEDEEKIDSENQETKELEKWEIEAIDGKAIINRETDTDENGFITVIYPQNTTSISIKLSTDISKVEKFEIINNKVIDKVEDVNLIDTLKTAKDLIIEKENEQISTQEELVTPIYYTRTFAELGIDKNKLATGVENKVNFTITLHTENEMFDLYANPTFVMELPKEIESINIDEAIVLNNTCFEDSSIDIGENSDGKKSIIIRLVGTQTEYTNSIQENIQIIINARIKAKGFNPTMLEQVNLYYQNENATTYNGVEKEEKGNQSIAIELASNKEMMVESKVLFGDKSISSRDSQETIIIEPNSYENIAIIGTVINNVGNDMQNVKILGTATNVGQISGVDKVYYTENPEANVNLEEANNSWSEEYTANAKKFLIVLDEFKQSQTVSFGYYMTLTQNIEEDITQEAKFEVYNSENMISNVAKTELLQEAQKPNTYVDDRIKADIIFNNTNEIEVKDFIECGVNVENTSEEDINDLSINLSVPENFEKAITVLTVNGEEKKNQIVYENNELKVKNLNLPKHENATLGIRVRVNEINSNVQKINATVSYDQKQIELFDRLSMTEKSQIETTITSDKVGKILMPKEEIEYKITAKNTGRSHATIDIETALSEVMNITKIKTINVNTAETKVISGTNLKSGISLIDIDPNETVEIYIKGRIKELEKDSNVDMYVTIKGEKVETTTTNTVSNIACANTQKTNASSTQNSIETNIIKGIAWIDENENGQKDDGEIVLVGIQAVLIDTKTSTEVARRTTNNKGEYVFKDIPEGNYIVQFSYNKDNFGVTDYTKKGDSNSSNSNVVSTTQNKETVAKTEVIKLQKGETDYANAGFVMNKRFDFSIKNQLVKLTANSEQGTKTYDLKENNNTKIEIEEKYLKNSLILMEYEITVANIGEVEGCVNLIDNQIPKGMKFSSELNTDWYEGENGTVYSVALANKTLKPGETETLKLVLIKDDQISNKYTNITNTTTIIDSSNAYLINDKEEENNKAITEYTIETISDKEGGRK